MVIAQGAAFGGWGARRCSPGSGIGRVSAVSALRLLRNSLRLRHERVFHLSPARLRIWCYECVEEQHQNSNLE